MEFRETRNKLAEPLRKALDPVFAEHLLLPSPPDRIVEADSALRIAFPGAEGPQRHYYRSAARRTLVRSSVNVGRVLVDWTIGEYDGHPEDYEDTAAVELRKPPAVLEVRVPRSVRRSVSIRGDFNDQQTMSTSAHDAAVFVAYAGEWKVYLDGKFWRKVSLGPAEWRSVAAD